MVKCKYWGHRFTSCLLVPYLFLCMPDRLTCSHAIVRGDGLVHLPEMIKMQTHLYFGSLQPGICADNEDMLQACHWAGKVTARDPLYHWVIIVLIMPLCCNRLQQGTALSVGCMQLSIYNYYSSVYCDTSEVRANVCIMHVHMVKQCAAYIIHASVPQKRISAACQLQVYCEFCPASCVPVTPRNNQPMNSNVWCNVRVMDMWALGCRLRRLPLWSLKSVKFFLLFFLIHVCTACKVSSPTSDHGPSMQVQLLVRHPERTCLS